MIGVEEFQKILGSLERALDQIGVLVDTLDDLRSTGLREEDLVALLYGRNRHLNKGTIRSVIGAISEMEVDLKNPSRHDRLLRILLADISGEGKKKTGAVLAGLRKIADRYGEASE